MRFQDKWAFQDCARDVANNETRDNDRVVFLASEGLFPYAPIEAPALLGVETLSGPSHHHQAADETRCRVRQEF